ncbi:sensor histidine kinase [Paenibacillus daejeonensis]|uniref:sensor histidine kinase n=1 Tax=Paenibacillus daejeonensis TaxID=135193 RepID=UPI000368F4F9|nr:HAMP domain-containing sensor histidine kinase [Paenibacillus daejeonensis]
MGNILRSFRLNMVLLFGLSMLLAGTIVFVLYRLLQLYYSTTKYEDIWTKPRYFIREIGDLNFFLLFFIPLSIYFFFLLTKRYALYFQQIRHGINQLANGNFNSRIAIDTRDEFGDIARDMNLAGEKLQDAIERGDFAENSKEQLVLNLAHDLRTPLTSVLGYLDYIIQGNEELTKAQLQHYASIAYTKSQRLEKLLEELFEIARMNYGKLTLHKTELDLNELLIQLTEELHPALEKDGILIRFTPQSPVIIHADGDLLARVVENLLTNAMRYGKDGKFIDLECRIVSDTAILQVINYGNRIPEEDLPHIFDMLYTVDKARTRQEGGGSGIGLFIARNIVEQHGGTLTAVSDEIRTIFEIRLSTRQL